MIKGKLRWRKALNWALDKAIDYLGVDKPEQTHPRPEVDGLDDWHRFVLAVVQAETERAQGTAPVAVPYSFIIQLARQYQAPYTSMQKTKEALDALAEQTFIKRQRGSKQWEYYHVPAFLDPHQVLTQAGRRA